MSDSTPAASSEPPIVAGPWPHLRALLVLAHLVAVGLLAIPDARGVAVSRSAWTSPSVQAELEAWAQRLRGVGYTGDAARLQTEVLGAAESWNALVQTLQVPVRPYADAVGMRQSWRMFVAPHRYPALLHVDLMEEGQWRPLYVARSDEHDWRAAQLDHVRTRGVIFRYAWPGFGGHYRSLARWIARRAGEDFPDAERVRIRYYDYRTPSPAEARAGTVPAGEFRDTADVALSRFR